MRRGMMSNRMAFVSSAFLVLTLVLVPKGVVAASTIGSSRMTLYAVADAYVNSSDPSANYGSESHLSVASNGEVECAYVMFDLSSIPSDADVLSAEIMLYLENTGGEIYWFPADRIGVYYCSDNSWDELEIAYGNKPSFRPTPTGTWSFGLTYYVREYKSWDVTQDLKTALPSGKLTELVKFVTKTGSGYANFSSREGEKNKPKLQVEYATKQVCSVHLESALDTGESANSGSVTFATETLSLPSNVSVVVGSYPLSYISGYNFVGWETSGGVSVSDPKAQNTTVNVSGNGTLKAVGDAKRIEYAYDVQNRLWGSEGPGGMYAVRFTPICSGQLMTVRFYIAAIQWINDSVPSSDNTFKVHVMDADRNDVIAPFSQTPALGYRWFDVDLQDYGLNVTSDVDFFVGIEWVFDGHPEIGKTFTSLPGNGTGRSRHWNGTAWTVEEDYDFMVRAVVGTLGDHRVTDGFDFRVITESNSTISDFRFIQAEKRVVFNVTGPSGTVGFCNVTIPKPLLRGDFSVVFDGENVTDFILSASETHTSLYLVYEHSGHRVEIVGTIVIPEYTALLFPLLMAITLAAVILKKRVKLRAL
jgi:hypothetical protein